MWLYVLYSVDFCLCDSNICVCYVVYVYPWLPDPDIIFIHTVQEEFGCFNDFSQVFVHFTVPAA